MLQTGKPADFEYTGLDQKRNRLKASALARIASQFNDGTGTWSRLRKIGAIDRPWYLVGPSDAAGRKVFHNTTMGAWTGCAEP